MLSHDKLSKTQERWRKKDPGLSDFAGKSLGKIKNQVFAADADVSTLSSNSYYRPGREGQSARDHDDRSRERSHDRSNPKNAWA